jgi:hypothetical protein
MGAEPKPRRRRSVAEQLLAQFAAFLRFERQGGRGPCEQTRNADRLAGFFAPAVVAGIDSRDGLLHFLQQLAFAVARAQFERMLFLDRCTITVSRRFSVVWPALRRMSACSCSSLFLKKAS